MAANIETDKYLLKNKLINYYHNKNSTHMSNKIVFFLSIIYTIQKKERYQPCIINQLKLYNT